MHFKLSSTKWRQFCLCLNVLKAGCLDSFPSNIEIYIQANALEIIVCDDTPYSLLAELTWSWWYHDASIIVPGDTANLWCHQWGESWHHGDSRFSGFEFNPRRVHDNLSVPLWVYMRFPVLSIKIKPTKLTHTDGEIDTSALIPDGLSVVQCSHRHVIGIVFLTQFQWHEANVLVNWQLAVLLQSILHYGLTWPVGIPIVVQTPVVVALHSPNGGHLLCKGSVKECSSCVDHYGYHCTTIRNTTSHDILRHDANQPVILYIIPGIYRYILPESIWDVPPHDTIMSTIWFE